ncbi:hypothetical protein [Haloferula sp.]|uniref:hypothetical protein n=1 Tax=Haloferula sp. TaxID=2497595 RepID=UPI003C7187C6
MMDFDIYRSLGSLFTLSGYIGSALLALGCWKCFVLTKSKTFLVVVISIGLSLLTSAFWLILNLIHTVFPASQDFVYRLYDNAWLTQGLWYLATITNITIFSALAWEFTTRLKTLPVTRT